MSVCQCMHSARVLPEALMERQRQLARKYIWWKTPEQAVQQPLRVLAQVMDIGDY